MNFAMEPNYTFKVQKSGHEEEEEEEDLDNEDFNMDWLLCRYCKTPFRNKSILQVHKMSTHLDLIKQRRFKMKQQYKSCQNPPSPVNLKRKEEWADKKEEEEEKIQQQQLLLLQQQKHDQGQEKEKQTDKEVDIPPPAKQSKPMPAILFQMTVDSVVPTHSKATETNYTSPNPNVSVIKTTTSANTYTNTNTNSTLNVSVITNRNAAVNAKVPVITSVNTILSSILSMSTTAPIRSTTSTVSAPVLSPPLSSSSSSSLSSFKLSPGATVNNNSNNRLVESEYFPQTETKSKVEPEPEPEPQPQNDENKDENEHVNENEEEDEELLITNCPENSAAQVEEEEVEDEEEEDTRVPTPTYYLHSDSEPEEWDDTSVVSVPEAEASWTSLFDYDETEDDKVPDTFLGGEIDEEVVEDRQDGVGIEAQGTVDKVITENNQQVTVEDGKIDDDIVMKEAGDEEEEDIEIIQVKIADPRRDAELMVVQQQPQSYKTDFISSSHVNINNDNNKNKNNNRNENSTSSGSINGNCSRSDQVSHDPGNANVHNDSLSDINLEEDVPMITISPSIFEPEEDKVEEEDSDPLAKDKNVMVQQTHVVVPQGQGHSLPLNQLLRQIPTGFNNNGISSNNTSNNGNLDVQMELYFQCEECQKNFLSWENYCLHKKQCSNGADNNNFRMIQTIDKDNNKLVKLINVKLVEKMGAFSRFRIIQTNIKMKDKSRPGSSTTQTTNSESNNSPINNITINNSTLSPNFPTQLQRQLLSVTRTGAETATSTATTSTGSERGGPSQAPATSESVALKNYVKPPLTFTLLSALALHQSKVGRLNVVDIYNYIIKEFPYFEKNQLAKSNWKNSVRHTLALSRFFQKCPSEELTPNGNRHNLWALKPDTEVELDIKLRKEMLKYKGLILRGMRHPENFEKMVPPQCTKPTYVENC